MTALQNMWQKGSRKAKSGELFRGEDWVPREAVADPDLRAGRGRRGIVALNRSPLTRKIIIFNLMALVVLVAGVLFMTPFRDSLVQHREQGLVSEAKLIANVVEAGQAATLPRSLGNVAIGPGGGGVLGGARIWPAGPR